MSMNNTYHKISFKYKDKTYESLRIGNEPFLFDNFSFADTLAWVEYIKRNNMEHSPIGIKFTRENYDQYLKSQGFLFDALSFDFLTNTPSNPSTK